MADADQELFESVQKERDKWQAQADTLVDSNNQLRRERDEAVAALRRLGSLMGKYASVENGEFVCSIDTSIGYALGQAWVEAEDLLKRLDGGGEGE